MSNKDTEKKSEKKKEIHEADLDKAVGGASRPTTPQVNPATPAGTVG